MRKIRRFDLTQSRCLSAEEMAELNGGETPLLDKCSTYEDVGKTCIYVGAEGKKFEGTCYYVSSTASDGSTTSSFSGYVCQKNP